MFNKKIFIFISMALVAISCDNSDSNPMAPEEHTDAEGLILELNGEEVYRQFQGEITNNLSLSVNSTLELSVHFLDDDGNEIEHEEHMEGEEEDELSFGGYDNTIISIEMEDHDDHDDACDDCVATCSAYVMENYGYTQEAANTWCQTTPNAQNGCAETCVDDHDDSGEEEHHEMGFELTGLSTGSTSFTISLMHDDHADFISMPINITVQ